MLSIIHRKAAIRMKPYEKTVYAFGDSIVAGHYYPKASFINYAAEGMGLRKFAINGATIMDIGYEGGQIANQVRNAPAEAPDFVVFDGGTNDAEYMQENKTVGFGTVSEAAETPDSYDCATFAGAFEQTVYEMKRKWPHAKYIFTAVHKMGSRDREIQARLYELDMQICRKWGIAVADVYRDAALDTCDILQKNRYTFDQLDETGLPGKNGSGTHPNLEGIMTFYVPIVKKAFCSLA